MEGIEKCRNCICLAEGNDGEWICDEANKPIEELEICPEGIEEEELKCTNGNH